MSLEEPPAPSSPDRPCCEGFNDKISDLHDGRWPEGSAECAAVEEHLATCPRCAELLDDYRLISRAAEALRAVEAPKACAEAMRRNVRARIRGRIFRRRLVWTGAGVAAAAAASVAVALVFVPAGEPPEATVAVGDSVDSAAETMPEPVDILRNPAVAALLRELEAEALRGADGRGTDRLTVDEELDLAREWGVFSAGDADRRGEDFRWTGFRDWYMPFRRPAGTTGVLPVMDDGH